jgi:hypothetical protein
MERLGKEVRIHRLETNLWLPQPRDRIFEFFANPINLERLTPDWLSFKILTKLPAELNEGTVSIIGYASTACRSSGKAGLPTGSHPIRLSIDK